MNENLKNLLKKLVKDEELQAKFQAAGTLDEAYALASSIQDGFTKEEFIETMKKLSNISEDQSELSDEDLEMIAGGAGAITWDPMPCTIIITQQLSLTSLN